MTILQLTPGLLISMAIRYDHSFGYPDGFWLLTPTLDNKVALANKQIKLIRSMKLFYDKTIDGDTNSLIDEHGETTVRQITEELTGRGFYRPDSELRYTEAATTKALLEAIQLVNDRVSNDGPKPVITIVDDEANPDRALAEYSAILENK